MGRTNEVTLSKGWQYALMAAMVLPYFSTLVLILVSYLSAPFINAGTWVYQIVQWLFPLLLFATGWLLLSQKAKQSRLFKAVVAAFVGFAAYQVLSMWANTVYFRWFHPDFGQHASIWGSFGYDWSVMALVFAAYTGVLLLMRKGRL